MGKPTTLNTFFRRRRSANLTSKPEAERREAAKKLMRKAYSEAPVHKPLPFARAWVQKYVGKPEAKP